MTTTGPVLRDGFALAAPDQLKWDQTIGAGGAISQSAGTLTLGSGTTINAATSLLSKQMFSIPCKVAIGLSLSQRIANQTFFVELVSVDPATGLPNGQETAAIVFDGTTATQARHQVTTGGLAPNLAAPQTYQSTAAAGSFEIEVSHEDAWFFSSGGIDTTTQRANPYRLTTKAPDPNATYKLRLRWLNGGTAPASNTNALVTSLAAMEYQELSTEIVGARPSATLGSALSVLVAGGGVSQSGTWTVQPGNTANTTPWLTSPRGSATGGPNLYTLNSAAGTNAAVVKGSAGSMQGFTANNASAAAKWLRFFNKATAPTPGTDTPVMVVHLPPTSSKEVILGPLGKTFSAGIGVTITNAAPVLDATAVAAGDVQVTVDHI